MSGKLKKGDFVIARRGRDAGKKGRILEVLVKEGKVLVEGINMVTKHSRPKSVDRTGGIIHIEKPIAVGNLAFFCMKCGKGVRVGIRRMDDGSKSRFCKKCGELTGV